jgi:hypothetical protein
MREKRLIDFHEKMLRKAAAGRGGSKRKACDEQSDQSPPSKVGETDTGGEDTWRLFAVDF